MKQHLLYKMAGATAMAAVWAAGASASNGPSLMKLAPTGGYQMPGNQSQHDSAKPDNKPLIYQKTNVNGNNQNRDNSVKRSDYTPKAEVYKSPKNDQASNGNAWQTYKEPVKSYEVKKGNDQMVNSYSYGKDQPKKDSNVKENTSYTPNTEKANYGRANEASYQPKENNYDSQKRYQNGNEQVRSYSTDTENNKQYSNNENRYRTASNENNYDWQNKNKGDERENRYRPVSYEMNNNYGRNNEYNNKYESENRYRTASYDENSNRDNDMRYRDKSWGNNCSDSYRTVSVSYCERPMTYSSYRNNDEDRSSYRRSADDNYRTVEYKTVSYRQPMREDSYRGNDHMRVHYADTKCAYNRNSCQQWNESCNRSSRKYNGSRDSY